MTFRNEKKRGNTTTSGDASIALPQEKRVLLKRRCLQVLTGKARYDYSHGIRNVDLFSDRRVSLTMRESPLTSTNQEKNRHTSTNTKESPFTVAVAANQPTLQCVLRKKQT